VSGPAAHVGHVAARSVRRTLRQPALVVPTITFPLFLLGLNASGLDAASKIPGFPADSYLDFALGVAFMQGAIFASTTAGSELATDIETGFLNRLSLTPLSGLALLLGQLAGAVAMALLGALIYLAAGLAFGVTIEAGVLGALALLGFAVLVGAGFGAVGLWVALRTGSAEAVQGVFPLLFAAFFLSSINLPRNLIETDWFRAVATWNPISYMVEAMRSLIISGWDWEALGLGLACALGVGGIAFLAAVSALRSRLLRT